MKYLKLETEKLYGDEMNSDYASKYIFNSLRKLEEKKKFNGRPLVLVFNKTIDKQLRLRSANKKNINYNSFLRSYVLEKCNNYREDGHFLIFDIPNEMQKPAVETSLNRKLTYCGIVGIIGACILYLGINILKNKQHSGFRYEFHNNILITKKSSRT